MIPPGTVSNQLVGVHDLMATVAALIGYVLPAYQARDSFNFLPVLLGQRSDNEPVRDHIIMEASHGMKTDWYHAFREGQWKLILDRNKDIWGLYNLADDLAETTNLMNDPSQASRIQRMRKRCLQLHKSARTAPLHVVPPSVIRLLLNDD